MTGTRPPTCHIPRQPSIYDKMAHNNQIQLALHQICEAALAWF